MFSAFTRPLGFRKLRPEASAVSFFQGHPAWLGSWPLWIHQRPPRCERVAWKSILVVGAAHESAPVVLSRSWAERLLYSSAVLPSGSLYGRVRRGGPRRTPGIAI